MITKQKNSSFFTLFVGLILLLQSTCGLCSNQSQGKFVYKVGPGDLITLTIIAGGVEQAKVDLVVSGQGEVTVPFIGNVKASGLTLKNLEQKIYLPLEKNYFVHPQINIQMKEYHSLSYTISGAVKMPAEYELDFHPSLMDLIAKAGGVVPERGNVAYVIREGTGPKNEPMKIDLSKLLDEGDMSRDIMLETGDKIYIPLAKRLNQTRSQIYLEGEIKKPGMIAFQPGITALSACVMAGGFDKYAAPARSRIIRVDGDKLTVIKINLDKIKNGEVPDVDLKPGDRIHVPESWL